MEHEEVYLKVNEVVDMTDKGVFILMKKTTFYTLLLDVAISCFGLSLLAVMLWKAI